MRQWWAGLSPDDRRAVKTLGFLVAAFVAGVFFCGFVRGC
jgi:hypothetical protein